jgi:hypothetical protein
LTAAAGACKVLADVLMQAGQRAVLGKVRQPAIVSNSYCKTYHTEQLYHTFAVF